jgi:hypothetical protein
MALSDPFMYTPRGRDSSNRYPFDLDRPLITHAFSNLRGPSGWAKFVELAHSGAVLQPAAARTERWGAHEGALYTIDKIAGDDRVILMSLTGMYNGSPHDEIPAVAFGLDDVFRHGRVGMRPHDLIDNFRSAFWAACNTGDKWIGWDDPIPEQCLPLVKPLVDAIARCGTLWDPWRIERISRIWNRMVFVLHRFEYEKERSTPAYRGDPDLTTESGRRRNRNTRAFWLKYHAERELIHRRALTAARPFFPTTCSPHMPGGRGLDQAWTRMFESKNLNSKAPEIVLRGSIPLSKAMFYRDRSGRWHAWPPPRA